MKYLIPSKWILAGEHSVIRGKSALVFPLYSRSLELEHIKKNCELAVISDGPYKDEYRFLIWGLLEKTLSQINRSFQEIRGELRINSNLPLGSGLGASATVCAGVTEFLVGLGFLNSASKFEFAREMENFFHGQSSGVDLAGVFSKKGICFTRPDIREELDLCWKPKLYLVYSGSRGITKECVEKVQRLFKEDHAKGLALDDQMQSAVDLARRSLEEKGLGQIQRIEILVQSLNLANQTYQDWGLVNSDLDLTIKKLTGLGAIACKPTGSGGGGFVLSLWPESCDAERIFAEAKIDAISCF